jgi:hypothetical protein
MAARGRTVTGGLTSPARLHRFLWSCKASGRCQSAGNTPVRSGCGDGGAGRTVTGGLTSPLALTAFLWSCKASGRCRSAGNTPVRSGCGDGGGGRTVTGGLTSPARLDRFFVVMQGERSMSIGRVTPGAFRLRRWRRRGGLLPGIDIPLAFTAFCGHARRAVDVNRPVTPRWRSGCGDGGAGRTVRASTSPARPDRFFVVMQGERSMSIGR